MSDSFKPNTPTRRNTRVHHEVMVGVTSEHGTFTGWGTNLSAGGGFVNSQAAPPGGTKVDVLLQLPRHSECKLSGRVAWAQATAPGVDEPGMGIEFVESDEETQKLLGDMVDKLEKD